MCRANVCQLASKWAIIPRWRCPESATRGSCCAICVCGIFHRHKCGEIDLKRLKTEYNSGIFSNCRDDIAIANIFYIDRGFRSNKKEELFGFTEFLCKYRSSNDGGQYVWWALLLLQPTLAVCLVCSWVSARCQWWKSFISWRFAHTAITSVRSISIASKCVGSGSIEWKDSMSRGIAVFGIRDPIQSMLKCHSSAMTREYSIQNESVEWKDLWGAERVLSYGKKKCQP